MTTETMREAFESWYTDGGDWPKSVEKDGNGTYRLAQAASAWRTFQAATAIERDRAAKVCEAEHVGLNINDDCDDRFDFAYNCALRDAIKAIRKGETP